MELRDQLDGYRLEAVKNAGETTLYSRRRNVLNCRFGYIADALDELPDGTVLDGEIVAMAVLEMSVRSRAVVPMGRGHIHLVSHNATKRVPSVSR